MKRIINIFLGFAVFMVIASCSSDDALNDVLDNTEFGIAMRSISEVNSFDLSDLTSTYSNQFEIDAVDGGFVPQTIRVLIGFTDDDDTNDIAPAQFTTMDPASFNETTDLTTHNLPVGTFSISLGDAVGFLGLTAADYDRDDAIDFEFEMVATDGTVFTSSNVGTNVAASGRFSFYNSPYSYSAVIDDPNRVILTSAELSSFSNSRLIAGDTDSVQLIFDASALVTLPTVTRTSTSGNTDDVIGPITAHPSEANTWFFLYTAGAANSDQISFALTGGESVSGFPMENVSFSNAFTIDNVVPTMTLVESTGLLTDDGSQVDRITITVVFSEDVFGDVTYTVTSTQFDTETITQDAAGEEEATIIIRPRVSNALIAAAPLNFTVTASGTDNVDGTDEAGNAIVSVIATSIF